MFILLRRSFTERPLLQQERPSKVRIVCNLAGCFDFGQRHKSSISFFIICSISTFYITLQANRRPAISDDAAALFPDRLCSRRHRAYCNIRVRVRSCTRRHDKSIHSSEISSFLSAWQMVVFKLFGNLAAHPIGGAVTVVDTHVALFCHEEDADRKSTRLNSSHQHRSRMPSSA